MKKFKVVAPLEGTIFNPDKFLFNNILMKIIHNDGYCITQKDKIEENICPCFNYRINVGHGHPCYCGLYKEIK